MDTATYRLLKKVLEKIIAEPESLLGHGLNKTPGAEIRQTGKIKFEVLAGMAAMHAFDYWPELYGITYQEGLYLGKGYLERQWNLQSHGNKIDPDLKKLFAGMINFNVE